MKMVLNNGLNASAAHTQSGRLKHVAASLNSLDKQGFIVVDFFKNGTARETCVCISDGFVSVKTYQNNQLATEMFRDVLFQKTFYYMYNNAGCVTETWLDSDNRATTDTSSATRDIMTHAPFQLFEELQTTPQTLIKGQNLAVDLNDIRNTRTRAA